MDNSWEEKIVDTIQSFPSTHSEDILKLWMSWLETNPGAPFYESWAEYAQQYDEQEALFTERRVYVKRVANELRELEIPPTTLQKLAKALAAVASLFLVVFLAVSRAFRISE